VVIRKRVIERLGKSNVADRSQRRQQYEKGRHQDDSGNDEDGRHSLLPTALRPSLAKTGTTAHDLSMDRRAVALRMGSPGMGCGPAGGTLDELSPLGLLLSLMAEPGPQAPQTV
jgi:hypothetical protein